MNDVKFIKTGLTLKLPKECKTKEDVKLYIKNELNKILKEEVNNEADKQIEEHRETSVIG